MRSRLLFIGVLAVMLAIAAGCAGATPAPAPTAAPAPTSAPPPTSAPAPPTAAAPTTVPPTSAPAANIKVWYITGSPTEIKTMQDLSAKFEAANPGITVDYVPTSFDDAVKTWKLAMDSDTGPDVGYIGSGGPFMIVSAQAGKLLDLAPIAKDKGWDQRISPWSNVLDYNQFGGPVYGVPFDYALVGVYYNKDIFKSLNLSVPTNWQDFQNVIAAVKAKGIAPFSVGGLDKWPIDHYTFTIALATTPYQDIFNVWTVQKQGNLKNPGWAKALQIFKDWNDKGYLNQGFKGVSMGDALNLFTTGKAAMMIAGTWNTPQVLTDAKFEAGYFPMPRVDETLPWHAILGPNNFWVVPKASKNQQAAVAYIDYMLGQDVAMAKWGQGDIPMFKFAKTPDAKAPIQADIYNATSQTGAGPYIFQNIQDVGAVWTDNTILVVDGKETPDQAVQAVETAYEKKLVELGK